MSLLPTWRAVLILVCLAPLGLLGYRTPLALDALLVLDICLLILVWLDARLAVSPSGVQVERFAPGSFSRGQPRTISYAWRNLARREVRLVVREQRPSVFGDGPPRRMIRLRGGDEVREELVIFPERRGRETLGGFAVRSIGPLGLGQRQGRIALPWEVTVFPSLPESRLKATVTEAARRREAGFWARRRLGEGRLFESLRDWVPGDDTRTIDWKASGRRRKLIARQYEEDRRQQVLLVMDVGRLLTEEAAGAARLEYVVRAVTDLAFAASRHDDNVGIMVFSDRVEHYVAPQRGRRGLQQILRVLAVVEAKMVEPDYPGAFRYLAMRNRKRALTILFTDVIDRLASAALVRSLGSLRPRHLPLAVTLRNQELDGLATARPADVHGAYVRAAAEELLHAREDALTKMRQAGVVVLDVPPVQASAAVVAKYLELKRRGRL